MNKTEMMYKADTGQRPYKSIESEPMRNEYERRCKAIEFDAFDESYIDGDDLIIHTPEYIKWLEEKVEQLSPKQ